MGKNIDLVQVLDDSSVQSRTPLLKGWWQIFRNVNLIASNKIGRPINIKRSVTLGYAGNEANFFQG